MTGREVWRRRNEVPSEWHERKPLALVAIFLENLARHEFARKVCPQLGAGHPVCFGDRKLRLEDATRRAFRVNVRFEGKCLSSKAVIVQLLCSECLKHSVHEIKHACGRLTRCLFQASDNLATQLIIMDIIWEGKCVVYGAQLHRRLIIQTISF